MTPMMEQYLEVKKSYPDTILFFRMGDFFEMFLDDAVTASRELGLTLTSRNKSEKGNNPPMCGVPHHAADGYIAKLVAKGYKVAVCDQVEDPKQAKGIVKREVVRIVTPGTVTDAALLNDGQNNFLMAICLGTKGAGVAAADISTGEISCTFLSGKDVEPLIRNELGAYQPSEIIMNTKAEQKIIRILSLGFICPRKFVFLLVCPKNEK